MSPYPGEPYPLGVTLHQGGANVAVYSPVADKVELCLFDPDGTEHRTPLPDQHGPVWHGFFPRLGVGARYGFRVHGPFDPPKGLLCNPSKLLLDPYARAIDGTVTDYDVLRTRRLDDPGRPELTDSAPFVPRSVVVGGEFAWGHDRPPGVPLSETVVYEVHVKGATQRHPDVPAELRGTYAGFAHPAFVDHLRRLGITAVELLPVHEHLSEPALVRRGLSNYWGYNTIGFFAPHGGYASRTDGAQLDEFRSMVKALHEAGIEVFLDVVYNHTAEGGIDGPTVCFRGFDAAYYETDPADRTVYLDVTGTGNTLDMDNPYSLQLVMDSLRYWVTEMHVDGFRFDLAVTLARSGTSPDRFSSFFDLVQQDPVLRSVKLIAEPWDVGTDGYQVGNFPPQWAEWNGKYRDALRDFWRAHDGTAREFATRFAGSRDLYGDDGRRPFSSVNFITAHDGFTLRDLVTYERKHNEANGDANRDGTDDNRSSNTGVEGETDDPKIIDLRVRRVRSLLTTLLLAQGTPMLLAGDELGHTQGGNNNAYCQDSETTWLDWAGADLELVEYTAHLVALRRQHAVFRRRRFLDGLRTRSSNPDIAWFTPAGQLMTDHDWSTPWTRALGVFLNGDAIHPFGSFGEPRSSGTFYFCINAWREPIDFVLPAARYGAAWRSVVDAADPGHDGLVEHDGVRRVEARSVVVLERIDVFTAVPPPPPPPRATPVPAAADRASAAPGRRRAGSRRRRP